MRKSCKTLDTFEAAMNSRLSMHPALSRKRDGGSVTDRILRRDLHTGLAPGAVGGSADAPADQPALALKARHSRHVRAGQAQRQKPPPQRQPLTPSRASKLQV